MQRGIKNQPGEIRLLLVAQKHLRHKEEALALMFLSLFLKRNTNTKVYLTLSCSRLTNTPRLGRIMAKA
jgi:hypothetical protein